MKLIISAFIALFAVVPVLAAETPEIPPLAAELANPLSVIIVTDWTEGHIGDVNLASLSIDDKVPVDDTSYYVVKTYGPDTEPAYLGSSFTVESGAFGNYYFGVSLVQQHVL